MNDERLDAQVYVELPEAESSDGDFESNTEKTAVFEQKIASWVDPFTPPKTRTKCIKWVRIFGAKNCIGWKLEKKWMNVESRIKIYTAEPADLRKAVQEALRDGAAVAAISSIVTAATGPGSIAAAEAAFVVVFKYSLARRLLDVNILEVVVESSSYWDKNWD